MESPIPGLDNREFALLAWTLVAVGAALLSKSIRRSFGGVLKTIIHWKILLALALMLSWVGLLLLLLERVGLWTNGLASEAVYWILFTGFVLLFRSATAGGDEDFFKRILVSSVGLTALSEFLINLRPMGLVVELLLVIPAATILTLTTAVAETRVEYRQAKGCLQVGAAVTGLGLVGYTVAGMVTDPETMFTYENFLELLVPILLTVGLLPFLYGTALVVTYGSLFGHLDWKLADNEDGRRYAKRKAIRAAHVRLTLAHQLSGSFHWRLAPQATREEVDAALRSTLHEDR